MQGQGFLFLVNPNATRLVPGQALVGYLQVPGEPVAGVVVPREAVVRTEGAAWVYVLDQAGAEAFARTEIPLDHPTDAGWFVPQGVSAGDYIVVKGAQQLLSIERRPAER
jgi:multidrug efflux pump subunit AcrA (membrane-fusion protein)